MDILITLLAAGIGVGLGWYLSRGSMRLRRALGVLALMFGIPVVLFVCANVLDSDTLGWIAGLSFLLLLALAVPVCIGLGVGWLLARSRRAGVAPMTEPQHRADAAHPALSARPTELRDQPPRAHGILPAQRGVLLAMAGVAAGFWVVLGLGFRLNRQEAPAALDQGLVPAAAVLLIISGMGVRQAWRRRGTWMRGPRTYRVAPSRSDLRAEREAWLAALAADPRRAQYATMIEAGDVFWTPARIEYDLDADATACCVYLAPIESAMRRAGVPVRLDGASSVSAACRIDPVALAKHFALPACVAYEEPVAYDRSLEDPPQALLRCADCGSRLWVLHESVASPTTSVFPAER